MSLIKRHIIKISAAINCLRRLFDYISKVTALAGELYASFQYFNFQLYFSGISLSFLEKYDKINIRDILWEAGTPVFHYCLVYLEGILYNY